MVTLPDGRLLILGTNSSDSLVGTAESEDIRGNAGNDTITGGRGQDILRGGSGNDILDGEEDVDEIFGGSGNDTLIGGSGAGTNRLSGEGGRDFFKVNVFDENILVGYELAENISINTDGNDIDLSSSRRGNNLVLTATGPSLGEPRDFLEINPAGGNFIGLDNLLQDVGFE